MPFIKWLDNNETDSIVHYMLVDIRVRDCSEKPTARP